MRIQRTLQPLQRLEIPAFGEFIYFRDGNGPIDVQVNDYTPITLDVKDQIASDHVKTIVITNKLNELNPIVLEIGHGRFVSSGDGQSVNVNNFPSLINVRQSAPVNIGNWPQMQSVHVANIPNVQSVKIENWKSIQAVKQSGDWTAKITNFPAAPSAMNSDVITIASGKGEVASNTKRIKVITKASASNSAVITVGNYPLEAGEKITLSTTGALALTGTDGDQLFYIEDIH